MRDQRAESFPTNALTPSKPFKDPAQIYSGVPKPLRGRPLPAAIRVSERPRDGGGDLRFDVCALPWWLCLRFDQVCPLKPALRGGSGCLVAPCLPYSRNLSRACQVALLCASCQEEAANSSAWDYVGSLLCRGWSGRNALETSVAAAGFTYAGRSRSRSRSTPPGLKKKRPPPSLDVQVEPA